MGQATREAREAGWIPGAMLAWAAQPLRPSTIHPDSSFVEDERGLGVRSQSDPSSAMIWKKCQEASVTHTSATTACVW